MTSDLERITGSSLNERWHVNANHALYRKNGTWYHQLQDFPGALFDATGYILFKDEQEFRTNPYLQIGKQVTVPNGISSIPGYVKVSDIIVDDQDTQDEDVYGVGSIYPYDSQTELNIQDIPFSVFGWLRKLEKRTLITNPDFQRNLVWKLDQKCKFIESIILNIPLPPLYVFQNAGGEYILIDGLQRTMTLREFVNDEFALKKLDVLSRLNGCRFSQLPSQLQTRIEDKKFIAYVIKPSVSLPLVYDIFNRINTGGTKLNRQEVRNCIYIGQATKLLKRLAASNEFRRAIDNGVSPKRMKDQEVVLRYLAFRLFDYKLDYKGDMDAFLGRTMKTLNQMPKSKLAELEENFIRVMKLTHEFYGDSNFRLPRETHTGSIRRGRVNLALLESVSHFFATQSDIFLLAYKKQVIQNLTTLLKNENYRNAITLATGDPNRVRRRFELAHVILGDV